MSSIRRGLAQFNKKNKFNFKLKLSLKSLYCVILLDHSVRLAKKFGYGSRVFKFELVHYKANDQWFPLNTNLAKKRVQNCLLLNLFPTWSIQLMYMKRFSWSEQSKNHCSWCFLDQQVVSSSGNLFRHIYGYQIDCESLSVSAKTLQFFRREAHYTSFSRALPSNSEFLAPSSQH